MHDLRKEGKEREREEGTEGGRMKRREGKEKGRGREGE